MAPSIDRIAARFRTGLWRQPDFTRFWAAQTISAFGTQVSLLALPLTAALTLDASPLQIGMLAASEQLPTLLFGFLIGSWVDRVRRRPLLIWSDLLRALALAAVPVAALLDVLSMPLLFVVAFAVGTLALLFDVAYMAFLPALVGKEHLTEANSKLETSISVAGVGGPGLAGALVALFTAPFAVLVDALSFIASALFVLKVQTEEPARGLNANETGMRRQIADGIRMIVRHPLLRPLAGTSAVVTFFAQVFFAAYVLYMARRLGLGASTIGIVFAIGGVGAVIGAAISGPVAGRLGLGRTLVWAMFLFGVSGIAVPIAVLAPRFALPMVIASEFLQWFFFMVYYVNAVTLRVTLTPDALMGRVGATFRVLTWGAQPIGSLVGGVLGTMIGLPWTLVVGEIGMFLAVGWLIRSPVRFLPAQPGPEQAAALFPSMAATA